MREVQDKKPIFSPPGWLVTHIEVKISDELAGQVDALRHRLVEQLGKYDSHCGLQSLMTHAIELLLKEDKERNEL
jgi:hypothetical protein